VIVASTELPDLTVIENGESAAIAAPSVTEMTTSAKVPTSVAAGVPESVPVAVSNLVQAGWFMTEKVNGAPVLALMVG